MQSISDFFTTEQSDIFYLYNVSREASKASDDVKRYYYNRLFLIRLSILFESTFEKALKEFNKEIKRIGFIHKLPKRYKATILKKASGPFSHQFHARSLKQIEHDMPKLADEARRFSKIGTKVRVLLDYDFETEFAYGKHGTGEIKMLMEQFIDDEDVFSLFGVDQEKLNSLFNQRNKIIHGNAPIKIQENSIDEFYEEVFKFFSALDRWMNSELQALH